MESKSALKLIPLPIPLPQIAPWAEGLKIGFLDQDDFRERRDVVDMVAPEATVRAA